MKYLKRYNESFGVELEEVQWCKDALQDLEDSGYKVSIRTYPVYGVSNPGISITIDSNTGKLLPITIGEYLLTLHSYLLENGYVGFRPYDYDNPYSLSRHQVTVNAQLKGVRNQFENELSQFVKMLDRFQVNAPFDSVSVSYYKPDVSPKDGDVYESIHDTKEEIEEIVSTCKDILLEAQHTFGNSDVEKSYKDDKVIISCFYKMPLDVKGKLEEYKSTMNDIHQRLIEYMTSQGFTYNNRGDRYTAYFDMRLGNITYNISFSKELYKEFIGHLRYLKKYNINESIGANIKSDIEDIALELTDCEIYYEITDRKYWKNGVDSEEALIIYLRDNQNRFFTIKDIEDVILRLKDYLKEMDYSIDLSIPDSDDYLTFDEFIEEFSGEELYHVNIIIYHNPRISSFQRKYTAHEDFYESVNESTEEDLKDILLDLQDMGYRVIHENDVLYAVTGEPSDVKAIVVRDVMKPSDWVELPWSELKDYALRIKDYLGDRYLSFMWRKVVTDKNSHNPYKTIELNDDTEINDRVWSFVIKYKE